MLRIFIISILFNGCILKAQDYFNDSLLYYEYEYFKNPSDSGKQKILLKKFDFYIRNNVTDNRCFNELKRIEISNLTDKKEKENFLWNTAIVSYLNNETDYAKFYLGEYEAMQTDTTAPSHLLYILIHKYSDTVEIQRRIRSLSKTDRLFSNLQCVCDLAVYSKKHLNFYLVSSALIPGSGTIMNGYILKGLLSFALTAASVYAIVRLVEYGLYINAVLWGTGVGLKFYTGNIKLTEKMFYKKESHKKNKLATDCELKLRSVLEKYPLTLKGQ